MTDADLTGRTLGGFRILRKLGSGGMAVVYKAHEGSLNRTVALKVIHGHLAKQPEFIARFQREARAAAQLSHPNIVQIYAVGEEDGVPFFSMEYVKGSSLQGLIESEGFLTAPRAVPILKQACQALAAAHEAGIVHRDIKPSNIMLDSAGRVKVTDFGIAHMSTESRLTQSGMLLGTPGYTSPEQCRGEHLDARSDIYSMGVSAYEMLTGHAPFNGDTPAALILQIIQGDSPPLASMNPTVPVGLQEIVAKMMRTNPAERFQSADDVVEALSRIRVDGPASITLAPLPAPTSDPTAPRSGEHRAAEPTVVRPTAIVGPGESPSAQPPANRRVWLVPLSGIAAALLALAGAVGFGLLEIPGLRGNVATDAPRAVDASQSGAPAPAATGTEPAATTVAAPAVDAQEPVADTASSSAASPGPSVAPADSAGEDAAAAAPEAPAPTDSPPGLEPRGTVDAAELVAAAVPAAAEAARPAAALPAPAPNTVATSIVGDYEHGDLVRASVESALAEGGFAIVDIVPRNRRVEDVARFEAVTTIRLVGARELEYFGRRQTQYTVALTLQATDLTTGLRAAGPFSATAEFTAINLETNLRQAAEGLGAELVAALDAR